MPLRRKKLIALTSRTAGYRGRYRSVTSRDGKSTAYLGRRLWAWASVSARGWKTAHHRQRNSSGNATNDQLQRCALYLSRRKLRWVFTTLAYTRPASGDGSPLTACPRPRHRSTATSTPAAQSPASPDRARSERRQGTWADRGRLRRCQRRRRVGRRLGRRFPRRRHQECRREVVRPEGRPRRQGSDAHHRLDQGHPQGHAGLQVRASQARSLGRLTLKPAALPGPSGRFRTGLSFAGPASQRRRRACSDSKRPKAV